MNNQWYSIQNKASADEAEVMIYDEIGAFGVSAKQFVTDLKAIAAGRIHLRLNTPGGEVFDGTAIFNALKEHPAKVTVTIDGLAASAGSLIAMAGDEIRIARNAYMMVHRAWGGVFGNAVDMRKYADILEKMDGNIVAAYAERSGRPEKEWKEIVDAETWFTAEEAVAAGLADSITGDDDGKRAKASSELRVYNSAKIPASVRAAWGVASNDSTLNGLSAKVAACAAPATAITKETPMNMESFKAYAAEHPEAVASYVDQGKKAGEAAARTEERTRLQAIVAECPNRPGLAISAFLAGQDAESVKLTVAELDREATATKAAIEAKDKEIERLKFQAGTTNPVGTAGAAKEGAKGEQQPAAPVAANLEPEAQAKLEWGKLTAEQKAEWPSERHFVLYRKAELSGQIRGK